MFKLTINLGNEAMMTAEDVSRALVKVACQITLTGHGSGSIIDDNGDKVGFWTLSISEPA